MATVDQPQAQPQRLPVRWVLPVHLTAVLVCVLLSLSDRGFVPASHVVFTTLVPFVYVALILWFVCPLAVIIAILRGRLTGTHAFFAVLEEGCLCFAQFLALLPACM